MKADPKIVVAGSRALPPGAAPRLVVRLLADMPPATTILLRSPHRGLPGDFEEAVGSVCDIIGLTVEWRSPSPTLQLPGRRSVWARDNEMIADADLVVCFYDVEQIGDDESSTVALVDKAMALEVPVYAYALTPDDGIIRVGEHDPKDLWSTMVPAA